MRNMLLSHVRIKLTRLFGMLTSHCSQLQVDLDKLVLWAQKWQMVFNVDKCKVMHVGNWEDRRTYYMEERELSVVSCEKDLGVWISADMKSSKQSMYYVRL